MLNNQLASDGIHAVGSGSRSGGNVFVASMPMSASQGVGDASKRDMEASTEHIIPLEKMPVSRLAFVSRLYR